MALDFSRFGDGALDENFIEYLFEEEFLDRVLVFQRLWSYYRNEIHGLEGGALNVTDSDWAAVARPYTQDQEFGLPARITGATGLGYGVTAAAGDRLRRKEVVIENDIAWRIDAGVHFLFGKPPVVESLAPDPERRRQIETVLAAVFEANGGVSLLQELALLGSVYGFVDLIVRPPEGVARVDGRWVRAAGDHVVEVDPLAHVRIEPVEAWRAIPVLAEDDYRRTRFYVLRYRKLLNRLGTRVGVEPSIEQETCQITEVLGPDWWQHYEDGDLVAEGPNVLGQLPVVHIQNLAMPGHWEGTSDVEPLIPLQDELNTRLSDRANRVTFQSFKMYLGRGIESFEDRPVAPGRMWSTDNPDASIEEFGGDAESPSEEAHISELRQALDKTSGMTPLAAGLLRDKLGNLSSAAALKVTLMGTLARLERKRTAYGDGLVRLNRMVLALLDRTGIFHTEPDERHTQLHWSSPLPENQKEKLEEARMKRDLGVPQSVVLSELGYDPSTLLKETC
jgi:SPP1 Gp6-like portal protein